MKQKNLIYNANIYTQADNVTVNSMAIYKNKIVAVGNNLEHDSDFKSYHRINLNKKTVVPGLVDAHTHFYYYALSLSRVSLDGIDSLDKCLDKIKKFSKILKNNEWVVGEGYSPDRFKRRIEPDKFMLDKVTGGRPAFIFSKDQHTAWVNSKALELAGYNSKTKDKNGGIIVRLADGEPNGILREGQAYNDIFKLIPNVSKSMVDRLYKKALEVAYRNGVTGVHSFDSPEGFQYFADLAEKDKLGLRINYYFPVDSLDVLLKNKIYYGVGNEFLRVAGIKIFADGSLGSQSALCFNKYIGSKNNYGIEVHTTKEIIKYVKKAGRLGMPCAIHAIGDKAVSNVLDAYEQTAKTNFGARHRIEHLQLIRKKDIQRLKLYNIVASMQPSHCPSDIKMTYKYWGKRGANSFIFKNLTDKNIDLAFGSDVPIEPLNPLHGIVAAVRRARQNSRDVFYPEQKLTALQALYNFTVGPAVACGLSHCRGYLMPDYPADFVVLSDDIGKISSSKIYNVKVLATVIDGKVKYSKISL